MDEGEVLLNEILVNSAEEMISTAKSRGGIVGPPSPNDSATDKDTKSDKETHSQWALGGNSRFIPVGSTVMSLETGIYQPFASPSSWGLEKIGVASDTIYTLPDMATGTVLDEVNRFWASEDKYRKYGLLYKRGIILWGPPGGGKTAAVKLLMNELVKRNGIVIVVHGVDLAVMCLKAIRRIEPPNRNIIVVFEDIDEIINYNGESGVLSMLDGESNVDNVLHIATTNYPERLGARIINRPSRFDRRVYVGMPKEDARREYLKITTRGGLDAHTLDQWVRDTEGMSIAHLRELVAAVHCLGQEYGGEDGVLARLKAMATPVKAEDGFARNSIGLGRASTRSMTSASAGFVAAAGA